MARIRLHGKYATGAHEFVLVDDDLVGYLSQWSWKAKPNGRGTHVYAVRNVLNHGRHTMIRMHRLILGMSSADPAEVDHRDHDTMNNRRSNLRRVTRSVNARNQRMVQRDLLCVNCGSVVHLFGKAGSVHATRMCASCARKALSLPQRSRVHFPSCETCGRTFCARSSAARFCSEACRCRSRYRRTHPQMVGVDHRIGSSRRGKQRGHCAPRFSPSYELSNLGNR